ncbi:MAG: ABC transporter substrate binding protein [Chloroflexota bacterium]|nr:ABC transporter substrate binding protein [Chloroflexota bacterium]
MSKHIAFILLFVLLLAPMAAAQDNDNPTVAILRFGDAKGEDISSTESGVLDMLEAYEYISADERAELAGRASLEGEHISIVWGDAGFEFTNAALAVDSALDQGADALVTLSTPMTQVAINATSDMDNPPAIIFAAVFNAAAAGIAESAWEKPAHVAGAEASTPYEEVLPLLLIQDPDLQVIGTIFNPAEASSVAGAEAIVASGEAIGLTVEQASVTGLADLRAATQSLVNKGATAILLPVDQTTLGGLPAILAVANEYGIPIFHANMQAFAVGATVTAGYNLLFEQGIRAGRILVGHLNGDINIANTAIYSQTSMGVGVNLDSAADQGVEISAELMDMAGRIMEDGASVLSEAEVLARLEATGLSLDSMPRLKEYIEDNALPVGASANLVTEVIVRILSSPAGREFQQEFLAGLACAE